MKLTKNSILHIPYILWNTIFISFDNESNANSILQILQILRIRLGKIPLYPKIQKNTEAQVNTLLNTLLWVNKENSKFYQDQQSHNFCVLWRKPGIIGSDIGIIATGLQFCPVIVLQSVTSESIKHHCVNTVPNNRSNIRSHTGSKVLTNWI